MPYDPMAWGPYDAPRRPPGVGKGAGRGVTKPPLRKRKRRR